MKNNSVSMFPCTKNWSVIENIFHKYFFIGSPFTGKILESWSFVLVFTCVCSTAYTVCVCVSVFAFVTQLHNSHLICVVRLGRLGDNNCVSINLIHRAIIKIVDKLISIPFLSWLHFFSETKIKYNGAQGLSTIWIEFLREKKSVHILLLVIL